MKKTKKKKGKNTTKIVELLDEKEKDNEGAFSVDTTLRMLEETQLIN